MLIVLAACAAVQAKAQQTLPAYQILDNDTTCEVFIYSPGEKAEIGRAHV